MTSIKAVCFDFQDTPAYFDRGGYELYVEAAAEAGRTVTGGARGRAATGSPGGARSTASSGTVSRPRCGRGGAGASPPPSNS